MMEKFKAFSDTIVAEMQKQDKTDENFLELHRLLVVLNSSIVTQSLLHFKGGMTKGIIEEFFQAVAEDATNFTNKLIDEAVNEEV